MPFIDNAGASPASDSGSDDPICTAENTPFSPRACSTRFSQPEGVPAVAVPRSRVSIASKCDSVVSGVPTATTGASLPLPYRPCSCFSAGCSPKPRSRASAAAFGHGDRSARCW